MSSLREALLTREQTPISYNQILRVTKNHVRTHFVAHDSLPEQPTDSDIFGSANCACMLVTKHIQARSLTLHHWVCLIKRGKGKYDFFDPLGNSIKRLTMQLHVGKKSLQNWASNRRVSENTVKLQQSESDINTCGCHVAVRLCCHDMRNDQYARWLKHGFLAPDLSVSALCYLPLLRKTVSGAM